MSPKPIAFPRWKIICMAGLLGLGAAALPSAQAGQEPAPAARQSPSSTAPDYGGAATQGGPGSTSAATDHRVKPHPPVTGASAPAPQTGAMAQGQPGISNADRNLMRSLAQIHMAEIDMGKMAQTRSQDVTLRSFAQRMIDDHGKALQDLQKLADAKGVVLPGGPGKSHVAAKEKLTAMTGEEFSRHYMMHAGDTAHQEAYQMLQNAVQKTQDPELKAQVGTSLALVEQHIKIANHLIARAYGRRAAPQREAQAGAGGSAPTSGASHTQQVSPADAPLRGVPAAPGSAPR